MAHSPGLSSAELKRVTRGAAMLSIAAAALLIGLKAYAWWASGSVAMLSSLADSTLDLTVSLFTFLAIAYAAAPPDAEHRFGHGKAEAFAGLVQAGLVGVSGALVALEAVRRLVAPEPIEAGGLSIAVMLVSIAVTGALILAQSRAVKKTGSIAIRGDRAHYAADLAANAAVIAGIAAGAFFGWTWADAAAGLMVAAWLAYGAWDVAKHAADHLLDRELGEAERARISALALQDPAVKAVHELRTRASGPYVHIQFHADLDATLSLKAAHDIVVAVEARIRAEFPTADILIHPDPAGAAAPHGHEDFLERRTAQG